jgi:hypothetical protein
MKKIVGGFLSLILFLPQVFPQDSPILNKLKSGYVDHDFGIRKIPFSLFGHKIFLKVRVNASRELNFVLDTGAVTTVDRRIAAAIGLESGKASLSERPASFLLDDLEVKDFVPVIADLPKHDEGDPDLEGFIGADLLRFFCVTLDYDAEEIVLSAAPPNPRAPVHRLPMRRQIPLGFPLIDGWVNGENKITMMIDTGSPFPLVCPITLRFGLVISSFTT